jgi:hypothetical protein
MFKNSWQLYIDNDKAWGMQPKDDYAMSACIHQLIIYGTDVQQDWPTGGMQVYLMQPTSVLKNSRIIFYCWLM